MERRRETEHGRSAVIQTQQGTKLEISKLLRYKHPGIWKAQTINLKLEAIPDSHRRTHRLMAIAQIDGELDVDGKPMYRQLVTVSDNPNLKPGMTTNGATVLEFKPQLTRGQAKLMFSQAYKFAEAYRENIP